MTTSPKTYDDYDKKKVIPYGELVYELRRVYDPEMPGISIWDLGLIYDLDWSGYPSKLILTHTLTSAFCPFADEIINNIKEAVLKVKTIDDVEIITTFDPPYTIERVPYDVRLSMGWV